MNISPRNKAFIAAATVLVFITAVLFMTPPATEHPNVSVPQAETAPETTSDGTIALSYSLEEFGLATAPEQISVSAYTPPCDGDFNYCFYYIGTQYKETNFESAGLRVKNRDDLTTHMDCLQTLPEGYENILPRVSTSATFSTSELSPLSNAGAGHYASGALYRLAYKGSCYEFETRVGYSQYANYPRGSIKEFMPPDQRAMKVRLLQILKGLTLPNGAKPFAKAS